MWVWVACHKSTPELPVPAPLPVPAVPADPAVREGLVHALSVYDGEPVCADVEALSPEPVAALLDVVRTVRMPPSAPMRAAGCLVDRHAAEAAEAIDGWMRGEDTLGLAILVANRIDSVPPELAARFTAAGLAGPHAAELEPLLRAGN